MSSKVSIRWASFFSDADPGWVLLDSRGCANISSGACFRCSACQGVRVPLFQNPCNAACRVHQIRVSGITGHLGAPGSLAAQSPASIAALQPCAPFAAPGPPDRSWALSREVTLPPSLRCPADCCCDGVFSPSPGLTGNKNGAWTCPFVFRSPLRTSALHGTVLD